MNKLYIYIIAPKTEGNIQVFDYFLNQYSEIEKESRSKELQEKSGNDIFDNNDEFGNYPTEKFGELFLMIKADLDTFAESMLDNVESPETFKMVIGENKKIDMTEVSKISERFWINN